MPASETVTLPDAVEDTLRERQYSAKSAARAVRLQCGAAKKRAVAPSVASYDPTGAGFQRREADAMDDDAAALLELSAMPELGAGGELLVLPELEAEIAGLAHTVNDRRLGHSRRELYPNGAGCRGWLPTLALDAANDTAAQQYREDAHASESRLRTDMA